MLFGFINKIVRVNCQWNRMEAFENESTSLFLLLLSSWSTFYSFHSIFKYTLKSEWKFQTSELIFTCLCIWLDAFNPCSNNEFCRNSSCVYLSTNCIEFRIQISIVSRDLIYVLIWYTINSSIAQTNIRSSSKVSVNQWNVWYTSMMCCSSQKEASLRYDNDFYGRMYNSLYLHSNLNSSGIFHRSK